MGGSNFEDWNSIVQTTIVLVGRTGNGKSSTGNSILGGRYFKSARSQGAVTSTCQIASELVDESRRVSVIDTPGLFESSLSAERLQMEISRCVELAREGVHALILVLSTRNRFTMEEIAAVDNLQTIFGDKVLKYMIVVFTGGDELEDEGVSLEEYLSLENEDSTPNELKVLLGKCGNRMLLFDNKTKDPGKQTSQRIKLLSLVDSIVEANNGEPYTSALFEEAQKLAEAKKKEEMLQHMLSQPSHERNWQAQTTIESWRKEWENAHAIQLKIVTEMVEEKLRTAAERQQKILEERLSIEQAAREAAELHAKETANAASEEMDKLRKMLEEAQKQREELQKKIDEGLHKGGGCNIL